MPGSHSVASESSVNFFCYVKCNYIVFLKSCLIHGKGRWRFLMIKSGQLWLLWTCWRTLWRRGKPESPHSKQIQGLKRKGVGHVAVTAGLQRDWESRFQEVVLSRAEVIDSGVLMSVTSAWVTAPQNAKGTPLAESTRTLMDSEPRTYRMRQNKV